MLTIHNPIHHTHIIPQKDEKRKGQERAILVESTEIARCWYYTKIRLSFYVLVFMLDQMFPRYR